jgi:stearoyl-CoA desaturase (delta-9 desaturase)
MHNETMIIKRAKGISWRNNWWVALLTFVEGRHNNHHAPQNATRNGLGWYGIDINWWSIRVMQLFGPARAIKLLRLAQRFLA